MLIKYLHCIGRHLRRVASTRAGIRQPLHYETVVQPAHGGSGGVPRKCPGSLEGRLRKAMPEAIVGYQRLHKTGEILRVALCEQPSRTAMVDDVREPPDGGGNDRSAA